MMTVKILNFFQEFRFLRLKFFVSKHTLTQKSTAKEQKLCSQRITTAGNGQNRIPVTMLNILAAFQGSYKK
jgi:hypothetical protein